MQILVADFETHYDPKDYTLTKLSTEAYIRDRRFAAHGCAFYAPATNEAAWVAGPQLRDFLGKIDWARTCLLCHHSQFDGFILQHHYGVRPGRWLCTLSMARLLLGTHLRVWLDPLRQFFGIAAKNTPYNLFAGLRPEEITPDVMRLIGEGAIDECRSIWQIFSHMMAGTGGVYPFPAEELDLIDMTIRMFTEPVIVGDIELFKSVWLEEQSRKANLLQELSDERFAMFDQGISEDDLHSAGRFQALLEEIGIDIEWKTSPKGNTIPAFAKNDAFMRELAESDDDYVAGLAEARMGAKSTMLQTRAQALAFEASRGAVPVYLRYCGAHTTRWAGGDKTNKQNLKRKHRIRRGLMAPDGYLFGAVDASQIECRLVNTLAGQTDVVEKFRNKVDPYIGIASQFYGRDITRADELERGTGKQLELSCGFGCGPPKFRATAKAGTYGPPIDLPLAKAIQAVNLYRSTHKQVAQYWKYANTILHKLANGQEEWWGPLHVKDGRIWLPNGTPLHYHTLEYAIDAEQDKKGWRVKTRSGWTWIWGSKLVENVVQALDRVVVGRAMIRMAKGGVRLIGQAHDEVWTLLPEQGARQALDFCIEEMRRPVDWLPDLPLDAEGAMDKVYCK